MISGIVTPKLEAMIRLHVEDGDGQSQAIDVKIDTAFTGFISLPPTIIAILKLPSSGYQLVQIADGNMVQVPMYTGVVIWDGKSRMVDFHSLGKEWIIGMAMLAGHDLTIGVRDGGAVTISLLP